jgi:DNA-binding NtrC family response regulator
VDHAPAKTTPTGIILILEPDGVLRSVLHDILNDTGYVIRGAPDLGVAIDKAREAPPELLVTAHYVDCVSGYDAANVIRKYCPDMDVLVVAGFPADDRIENRLLNNASSSFPAPYNPSQLLHHVRKLLKTRAERR